MFHVGECEVKRISVKAGTTYHGEVLNSAGEQFVTVEVRITQGWPPVVVVEIEGTCFSAESCLDESQARELARHLAKAADNATANDALRALVAPKPKVSA